MDWLVTELHRIQNVLIIACVVFAIGFVLITFFAKKSFVALITALLVAALFVWGVNNIGWFRDRVRDETGQDNRADFGSVPNSPIMNPQGMVFILSGDRKR
jgi:L-asparagine transporter-like permease